MVKGLGKYILDTLYNLIRIKNLSNEATSQRTMHDLELFS